MLMKLKIQTIIKVGDIFKYFILFFVITSCSSSYIMVDEKQTLSDDYVNEANLTFKEIGFENDSFIRIYPFKNDNVSVEVFNKSNVYFNGIVKNNSSVGEILYVSRDSNLYIKNKNKKFRITVEKLKLYRYIYVKFTDEDCVITFSNKPKFHR